MMFVSIYYKPSLFKAHTMILIVHIFINVNKLCLNHKALASAVPDRMRVSLQRLHLVSGNHGSRDGENR